MNLNDMIDYADTHANDLDDWPVHMYWLGSLQAMVTMQVTIGAILDDQNTDEIDKLNAIEDFLL